MQERWRLLLITFVLSPINVLFAQYENAPKLGQQSPMLTIKHWVKGQTVSDLELGQRYVIEFSATWCVPCRKSIPHLTELARQYNDTFRFISVYVEDNNLNDFSDLSYIKKVEFLVDALGDKVGFSVAVDAPQQTSKKAWGINGIPVAFVVNETGKISWVGHPMDLDTVLQQISVGQFDPIRAQQHQILFQEKVRQILAQRSLPRIDSLIQSNPSKTWLYKDKFDFLSSDPGKAYMFVQFLLDSSPENFDWLGLAAGFNKIPEGQHKYEIELKTLDRCIEESETSVIASYPMFLKGEVYAAMGNFSKAVEWGERASEAEKMPWESKANSFYTKGLTINRYQLFLKDSHEKASKFLQEEVKIKKLRVDDQLITPILKSSNPDYALALELVSNALLNEQDDIRYRAFLMTLKSRIYAERKDFKEAVAWSEHAVAEYNKKGGNPRLAKKQLAVLEEYKQKLGGG